MVEVDRAVNFCGGLHHAMPDYASGFCIYNDAALAIKTLLDAGIRKVAYVDVDAHHGDGVQAAFYDDPRVLTVSIHESPLTLFPGTGFAAECGRGDAQGTVGEHRATRRNVGCRLAQGISRGCPRCGDGLPAGDSRHPTWRRLAPGRPARRPEPDHRRAANVLRRAADPGRNGHRWALAGAWRWRLFARCGWCREPGPTYWASSPAVMSTRRPRMPEDWIALAATARPDVLAADRHERRHNGSGELRTVGRDGRHGRRPGHPGHQEPDLSAARPRPPRSA